MHDGDSLECVNYFSDVFYANTGIWWHCDDNEITEISAFPVGVYTRESHKNNITNKNVISGYNKILLFVYIRTSKLISSRYIFNR